VLGFHTKHVPNSSSYKFKKRKKKYENLRTSQKVLNNVVGEGQSPGTSQKQV